MGLFSSRGPFAVREIEVKALSCLGIDLGALPRLFSTRWLFSYTTDSEFCVQRRAVTQRTVARPGLKIWCGKDLGLYHPTLQVSKRSVEPWTEPLGLAPEKRPEVLHMIKFSR